MAEHSSLLLTPKHWQMLTQASAIAPALVQQRGYQSLAQPADLIDWGFSKEQAKTAPVLGIPLWDVHGKQHGWQIRPDAPRLMNNGKVFKYELPKGDRLILDVHPSVQPRIGDPHEPLWVTEGVRKGDALASQGVCALALVGGVWGFKGKNAHGGKVILPDWDYVALNDRMVYVVYDSDIYLKPEVDKALKALYQFLRDRQARPGLVRWPEQYRQTKIGVDDFLAQGHTLAEVQAMVPPMGPLPTVSPARRNGPTPHTPGAQSGDANGPPLPLSDYTNALAFVREHGQDLRYCEQWGKWLVWSTTHWRYDQHAPVMQKAKATIRRLLRETPDLDEDGMAAWMSHIKRSLSTAALNAMVASAQNEPGIPIAVADLNHHHWLLPCPNGTLDLRTGHMLTPEREHFLTECIAVAYDAKALCPRWETFLWRIMGGTTTPDTPEMSANALEDRERADTRARKMITYLQRVLGQCLTGDVREQDLYVFFGTGANGKSTLINTILTILARYAMKGTAELLMETRNDRHPTERADLFGRRLVATIETQQAGRLNEVFIKEATGGDPIRARRMREDFWEFLPTHKIILATNHKPEIRGTDRAIWRRIKLVPFTVTITDEDQDTTLPEQLHQELPGILAWMVRGCLAWQQDGLQTPEEVLVATDAYQKEQDVFQDFLDTECSRLPAARCSAADLYATYERWCADNDVEPLKKRAFGMRLGECGCSPDKGTGGRREWVGIGLPDRAGPDKRYEKSGG